MSPSKDDLPNMISAMGLNTDTGSNQQTGNTPSSSRQGTHVVSPLDFMIDCFAQLFFLGFLKLHVEI
jgi:hypothetical protein